MNAPFIHPPTPEQSHCVDLAVGTTRNFMINSYAGTGKTNTLKRIAYAYTQPILYLAFNRRNIDEAEAERNAYLDGEPVFAFPDTTEFRTFNSLGHRIWAQAIGLRLSLNKSKTRDLLRVAINELPKRQQSEAWDEYQDIVAATGLAKALGYVPDGKYPSAKRLCDWQHLESRLDTTLTSLGRDLLDHTLTTSIKAGHSGTIDYDDQVYLPALFGGTFPSFPMVLGDEAQDWNPCNHAMLKKLDRSRIGAVGDPRQSIYAFRGAVQGGMAELKEHFQMEEAELTISFRCPETIVNSVRWHVPQMKAAKGGGRASRLTHLDPKRLPDGCAILCRNNAPLFKTALQLLATGRSVSVAGSDIGPRVVGIMRKLGDDDLSRVDLLSAIDLWLSDRLARGSTSSQDIADCMKVFANHGQDLGQSLAWAEDLFAQRGTINLLTGHKAKGLEWDIVHHLDPWLIGETEQELNLRYVIATRAKAEYYEIDGRDIQWS